MKHVPLLLFVIPLLIILLVPAWQTYAAVDPGQDFRQLAGQDIRAWLAEKNFMFERAADEPEKTQISVSKDKGLVIEALKPAQALLALKKGHLENYETVELVWGVDKFPPGASYVNGRRNEAIMFYAFFGKEMIDSGSMVVPDSPYFIALHLCETDPINVPQKGRFYHEGGRFICVAHPKPGEVVTTNFNLKKAFKEIYGKDAPSLYGIAFEFDTTNPKDDGTASAFVQKVHFPDANYIKQ